MLAAGSSPSPMTTSSIATARTPQLSACFTQLRIDHRTTEPAAFAAAFVAAATLITTESTATIASSAEPAAVAAASVAERGDRRSALGCQNALEGADYALPNALRKLIVSALGSS